MPNTLLTISMITREALMVLENNLTFTKTINRAFDDKYGVEGAKIGTTLNVRKPPRYTIRTGQALQIQGATETQVPIVLDQQIGVDLQFSSQDLALSIDDFSDRFLTPAIATIANKIDADGLALYSQIYQAVGSPGVVPNALLTYLSAGVALDNSAAPIDGNRSISVTPNMQATIVDALKGLFQQATAIADQYLKGQMGRAIGFTWNMDQNCATHTVGPLGGTPLINGANQSGASILTKGWTATTGGLNKGDVITFAGVNSVNPQSYASTGSLQQFVVTATQLADGGGLLTVAISPSMVLSGPFQNVTGSPADGAVIQIFGAVNTYQNAVSPTGFAYHRDFATLACADLPLPRNVDMASRASDKQLGLSLRLIRDYDISTDNFPVRLDVLYGWAVLRPELCCRIQS